ncbi:alpha-1,2-fucosyltransferase [Candidatus Methylopumilus universalis]|uniref:alpha-1,2-fucosyltransferase n=1 Tax=Candidatus Methylopumilus universalis TaxID=2588536 RepID=UPI003BEF0ECA
MKKIYLRLAGGLGNQIFQYTAALLIKKENDLIYFYTGALNSYKAGRSLELVNFFELSQTSYFNISFFANAVFKFRLAKITSFFGCNDLNFSSILSNKNTHQLKGSFYLDGYFQDAWSYEHIQPLLIQLSADLKKDQFNNEPYSQYDCIMHIRGSDFLANLDNSLNSVDFYIDAIKLLKSSYTITNIYVVTDDLQYSKSMLDTIKFNFKDINFSLDHERKSLFDDFMILLHAKSRIIGTSTFAWWASALDDKKSITISPKSWKLNCNRKLVLPWEKLVHSQH